MVKRSFLFLLVLTAIPIFIFSAYSQAEKKTITLPSGEVICYLNGEWNVLYAHYGALQWVGDVKSMVKITQRGNIFVGTSLVASTISMVLLNRRSRI